MIIFPNAKINLGLHIVEKRPDGFHNLETVFYPIPLCDVLEIVESKKEVKLFNYGFTIDAPLEKNSCVKAYEIVRAIYPIPAVDIHLYKHIPFGAGLGGGSSDATHMLVLLNSFFQLNIPGDTLKALATELGSDCAFFLHNCPMYATGRGEILQPIELNLSGKYLVLVKPPLNVSTVEAYRGVTPKKPNYNIREVLKLPITEWREYLQNDFEVVVFDKHPLLKDIKEQLYTMGALYASMSGSGSTMYGIFEKNVTLPSSFTGYFTWVGQLS